MTIRTITVLLLLVAGVLSASVPSRLYVRQPVKVSLVYERYGSFLANEVFQRVNAYEFDGVPAKSMIVKNSWYEDVPGTENRHLIFARLERYVAGVTPNRGLTGLYPEDLVFSRVDYSDGTFIEKGKRR